MEENNEGFGFYAFCVISSADPANFGAVNLANEERDVFTVHYDDLAMVVAKAPIQIYLPDRDNLLAHEKAVTSVMKFYSVVPVSFGHVFKSEQDIQVLLKKLETDLRKILQEIDGKIEVGLKLFGRKSWLQENMKDKPEIKKLQNIIDSKSYDAAYYDRIQLGELAQNYMLNIQNNIQKEIFKPLETLSVSAKLNDPSSELMLLNAAFLIDKKTENEFDSKVNELYEKWQDKLDFKYTGPWPPYNFINIKLTIRGGNDY